MACSTESRRTRSGTGGETLRIARMLLLLAGILGAAPASAAGVGEAVLYKDPHCGCCEAYADHLRANGFAVTVEAREDLALIKHRDGVPGALEGCHTMLVDGYVVEGHVPVNTLLRLLTARPDLKGISLPGMPAGSPGMGGEKAAPFTIYEIGEGPPKVYAVE
jgi:hypothetical protein